MKIGILKEIKATEQRIVLVPDDVRKLVDENHQVLFETGAGEYAGYKDSEYEAVGVDILPTSEKIFKNSELLLKVQPPMPVEVDLFTENQICISFLMAQMNPDKSAALLERKATFFALELLGEKNPVLESMNDIAAHMAYTQASKYLEWHYGGKGIHLGHIKGIQPPKIMIIGSGSVAKRLVKNAISLGLEIYLTDEDDTNLEDFKRSFDYKLLHVCTFSRKKILNYFKKIDVLFTASINPGQRSKHIFSREEINNMEKGSVIVDLAIDHGGNIESSRPTSPENPIYNQDELIYYCVPNMPSALSNTSSQILSKTSFPFIKLISDNGIVDAINNYPGIKNGIVFHRGKIVNQLVAESLGYEYFDINEIFDLNI